MHKIKIVTVLKRSKEDLDGQKKENLEWKNTSLNAKYNSDSGFFFN